MYFFHPYRYPYSLPPPYLSISNHLEADEERMRSHYRKRRVFQVQQVDWQARYPGVVVLRGPSQPRRVALTFDDGPDRQWTPAIANVLNQYGVKGTFFVLGQMVDQNPDILQQLVRAGHEIGNHTYSHRQLPTLTQQQLEEEVNRTENAIYRAVGIRTQLIRPPYGELSDSVIQYLRDQGYKIILWNVDSLDWSGIPASDIVSNVLAHTTPGSIILFHSAFGRNGLSNTVQALPRIIQTLQQNGYSIATISQLIGDS